MIKSSTITDMRTMTDMNDKENESPILSYNKIESRDIIKYHSYSPSTHTFIYLNRRELEKYKRSYIEKEQKREKEREKERKKEREKERKKERENERENTNLEDFRWLMENVKCMN